MSGSSRYLRRSGELVSGQPYLSKYCVGYLGKNVKVEGRVKEKGVAGFRTDHPAEAAQIIVFIAYPESSLMKV